MRFGRSGLCQNAQGTKVAKLTAKLFPRTLLSIGAGEPIPPISGFRLDIIAEFLSLHRFFVGRFVVLNRDLTVRRLRRRLIKSALGPARMSFSLPDRPLRLWSACDPAAVLDFVEEALDQVPSAVEMRTKA